MKNTRKILSGILALTMLCTASSYSAFAESAENTAVSGEAVSYAESTDDYMPTYEDYSYFEFTELKDGTLKISENPYGDYMPSDLTIPAYVNGKKVTVIGEGTFHSYGDNYVHRVVVPDTVTTIERWAFNSSYLNYVIIPESVTRIDNDAFEGWEQTLIIKCSSGSAIKEYAKRKGIGYRGIDTPEFFYAALHRSPDKYTDRIKLECGNPQNGVKVYFYNESADKWESMKIEKDTSPLNDFAVIKTGLKPGTNYKFMTKRYIKQNGKTYWSQPYYIYGVTKPAATTVLKSNRTSTAIRLNWKPDKSAEGYRIQQLVCDEYGLKYWKNVAEIDDAAVGTYRMSGFKKNTAYKFRVQSYVTNERVRGAAGYPYKTYSSCPTIMVTTKK